MFFKDVKLLIISLSIVKKKEMYLYGFYNCI